MIISGPTNTRKIPTLLGLGLILALLVGVGFTTQAVQKITRTFSQAETADLPISVGLANPTDNSITIFWATERETSGTVFYGRSKDLGEGVAVDQRDLSAGVGQYLTHLVRLTGLKPQTKYFFKVGVGTASFGDPGKDGNPYELITGPTIGSTTAVEPIFGKVLDESEIAAPGVLVLWQIESGTKISTLSKNDGSYVLPIGSTRTLDLQNILGIQTGLSETIILNPGGNKKTASITCRVGLDRPLPTIKLGETLDCEKKSVVSPTGGFKISGQTIATPAAGQLLINVNNGQTFNNSLPTISGKAGSNQVIQIVIHSETPYSGTVQANPDGSWSWTPPASLSPGQHTVTITVVNSDGTTTTQTRTFAVESGSPILPITSGTPSASLTHLACVGNTCSTVSGAGLNSCVSDTDCAPIASPSPTPIPVPTPTPPPTGSTQETLVLLTLGLVFATLGIGILARRNGQQLI